MEIARSVASRVYAAPVLPGAERLLGDIKQATYLETAALLAAVPAAALFFGRILPARLEGRGVPFGRAHGAGMVFAASLLLWRRGVPAIPAFFAALLFAGVVVYGPSIRRSMPAAGAAVLALFRAGLFLSSRPASRLDLFEDGQILFGAAALAGGGRPYIDFYPVHGWGADGGWNAPFFRPLRHGLEAFRTVRAVMTALALAALGASAWLFFEDAAWAAVAMTASLAFCPFLSERHMAPLLSLCLLLRAARSANGRGWVAAGAASAITLFATLDFGVIAVVGGALAPLVLHVVARDPGRRAVEATLRFSGGVLLGSAPFALRLASRGALGEFLRVSFVEIPATITQTWGLPADSITAALKQGTLLEALRIFRPSETPGLCALLVILVLSAVVLVCRSQSGRIDAVDRAATVCLLFAMLALRGVLGRADAGHRLLYGVLAGLPSGWLLYRISQASGPRWRVVTGGLSAAAFCLVLRPDRVVICELTALSNAGEIRRTEERAADSLAGDAPTRLPRDQVREIATLRRVIDAAVPPEKTFFDFGNEPGLYFLLDRKAPVRYSCVPLYEARDKQREVIDALERERPPIAILSSDGIGVIDSVSNADRAPLVASYLDAHYRLLGRIGPRTLGILRTASELELREVSSDSENAVVASFGKSGADAQPDRRLRTGEERRPVTGRDGVPAAAITQPERARRRSGVPSERALF